MSPPARWNEAPADVKCAVGWVKQHAVPYGEHGYDFAWGDWGNQISRRVFADFLDRKFPAN
jgi:hypothetical protein